MARRLVKPQPSRSVDAAIIEVANKCPMLAQLNVWLCGNLTDAAIIAVANKCPKLAQLNVGVCRKMTDAAIIEVANKCRPQAG